MTAARSSSIWCNQGIKFQFAWVCYHGCRKIACLLQWSNVSKVYNDDDTTHASKCVTIPGNHCDRCRWYKIRLPHGMRNKVLFKFDNTNNTAELHTAFFINFSNFNLCKSYAVLAMTGFSASFFSLFGLCALSVSAILQYTLIASRITDRRSSHGLTCTGNFQFICNDRLQHADQLLGFFYLSFVLLYNVHETEHVCSGLTRTPRGLSICSIPWKSLTVKSSVDVSNLWFRCLWHFVGGDCRVVSLIPTLWMWWW